MKGVDGRIDMRDNNLLEVTQLITRQPSGATGIRTCRPQVQKLTSCTRPPPHTVGDVGLDKESSESLKVSQI